MHALGDYRVAHVLLTRGALQKTLRKRQIREYVCVRVTSGRTMHLSISLCNIASLPVELGFAASVFIFAAYRSPSFFVRSTLSSSLCISALFFSIARSCSADAARI